MIIDYIIVTFITFMARFICQLPCLNSLQKCNIYWLLLSSTST